MKITIEISKRVAKHIASPHTFYDSCSEVEEVMKKVQEKVDKALAQQKSKHTKKCEICRERKAKIIFIHTKSPNIRTLYVCEECDINLLTQYYNMKNEEVEKYLREVRE